MKRPCLFRTVILVGSLLLQLNTFCLHSHGAAGDVDLSFDPGLGVNGPVNAIAVQADGKVIIGGQFTTVRGLARTNLARLNPDGSGDATFSPGFTHASVDSLVLQQDGKLLVGGQFVYTECYDDWGCYNYYFSTLARLHPNGDTDASFTNAIADFGSDFDFGFTVLALQPDGKVLVGGSFFAVNNTGRNGIARLNANGTLDTSFNPGTGIGGHQPRVFTIAVQADDKVVVGGMFDTFNGTNHSGIARLNANGVLDNSFNPGPEVGYRIESIVVQTDGKLLVGGYFGPPIARLNADGSLDSSFNPGIGADGVVWSVAVQSDGKVLIDGQFTVINGTKRNRIARLNTDGSLDSSFNPGTGMNSAASSVVLQSDGKVLVGGGFTTVNDTRRNRVARLNADGNLDGGFDPGLGLERTVYSLAVQPDGKVLVGDQSSYDSWLTQQPLGGYAFVTGTNRYGRVRLEANGSFDRAFISHTNFRPDLTTYIQPDDCIDYPGYNCQQVAVPVAVLVQADGKVLIGGVVQTTITGEETWIEIPRLFLDRFNGDGSRDTSFERVIGDQSDFGGVGALAVQPDGRIIVGGSFRSIKGTNRNGIARLNANGSLDSSFNPDTGAYGVSAVAVQPDGKVLISGYFLARLNSDGSRDACYNPIIANVYSLAMQPDGRVLVGGAFSTVNGVSRKGIARLNDNASLDTSFDPGTGADGVVRAIALQPDGNVLIGGDFITVNGILRPHVARLFGGPSSGVSSGPALRLYSTNNNAVIVAWPSSAAGFTLQENTSLVAPHWMSVTTAPATVGLESQITISAPADRRFFRLFSNATTTTLRPPAVAPQLNTLSGDGRVSLSWTAFSGATSHHVQRATNYYGPYNTIANPGTPGYTDTAVVNGTTYYYIVSVVYPCGESASSFPIGSTPHVPPSVHVQSIALSFVPQGSRYHTRAVVRVVDHAGTPVSGATVTGNFTGSITNAGRAAVTTGNGEAIITSSSTIKNGTVTFTVVGVASWLLDYYPDANAVTSATITR